MHNSQTHLEDDSNESQLLKRPIWLALTLVAMIGAVAVLGYTYNYAAVVTHDPANIHFHLFWLGQLLFFVPALLWLMRPEISRLDRLTLLSALAAFDYLPKYLRDPNGPLFHDELAHWRQAELLKETGQMYQPNPTVDIIQFFPGLHTVAAALSDLSGLSIFQIGTILLLLLHVLALLGIYFLASRLTASYYVAGIAALLYNLNASYMFFDTQFSYESMAIVMVIWSILGFTMIQDRTLSATQRMGWWQAGVFLSVGLVVTHHLSSYILVLILMICSVVMYVCSLRSASEQFGTILAIGYTLAIAAAAVLWLLLVASNTVGYLAPNITRGITQVAGMIHREQNSSRQLFAGSTTPFYERICSFLSPAIAGIAALGGLKMLRDDRKRRPVLVGLALFSLLYFPSVLFILTPNGNEGARRSWAFSYIGLCVLVSPFIIWFLQRTGVRWLRTTVVVVLACIVFIGNIAMGLNETYIFPGAYIYGSDTRTLTQEVLETAQWFRETKGVNVSIVSDRYNGLALSSIGMENTSRASAGFPVYQLYFSSEQPSNYLMGELQYSSFEYMLTDKNMTRYLPKIGVYFEPDEPLANQRTVPPPLAAITRFNSFPWTIKIYQSDNLAIYRYNFDALGLKWQKQKAK